MLEEFEGWKDWLVRAPGSVKPTVDLDTCKLSVDAIGGYVKTKEMLFNILIP